MIGLVGQRGTGKTALILEFVDAYQNSDLTMAGVISPGIFEGSQKIAIELIHLPSRQGRMLAVLRDKQERETEFGDWSFIEGTFDWANQRLQAVSSCDLLILDELGPLELDFNQGLQAGLALLAKGEYQLGVLSLRPKCAAAIKERFPEIELLDLDSLGFPVIKRTLFRIAESLF